MRANSLLSLPDSERRSFLEELTDLEALVLRYDWGFWRRDSQVPPPGAWSVCFFCAGRGAGKTRSGAEWVRERVESGVARRIAFVAETPGDARDIMVEGDSGILAVCPPWDRPDYEPSKRRVTWNNPNFPSYGAQIALYTSAEPDWLRGPQFDTAWADEIAAWRHPRETWDNLELALRLGAMPQVYATSTPKPIELVRDLLSDSDVPKLRGSTLDNAANLPGVYLRRILKKYAATRTGRQEIYGDLLEQAEGALWRRAWIEENRLAAQAFPETLMRVVVAIDPAVSSDEGSNETGIIGAGADSAGVGYTLADRSDRYTPLEWADAALDLYAELGADEIVAEANNGGDLVVSNVRVRAEARGMRGVPVRKVHASRGKRTRAEPVANLTEGNSIRFVGTFSELEDQLVTWEPGKGHDSPDRLDAFVWAFTRLLVTSSGRRQQRASHWG